nr:sperm-associated antigen 5 [Pogona vitticeps]
MPALGTLPWAAPLVWLEQILPDSPLLEDLRRSLPWPLPRPDPSAGASPSFFSGPIWAPPLSLPKEKGEVSVSPTGLPEAGGIVAPEEEGPGGLRDEPPPTPDVVASPEVRPPASVPPEGLTSIFFCLEEKSPPLEQSGASKRTLVPASDAETPGPPPCLPEAGLTPSEEGAPSPALEKEGDPSTPLFVAAGEVLNSPPPFPEAGGHFSCPEESFVSEQGVGTDRPGSAASGETLRSPPGLSEAGVSTSLQSSAPLLWQGEGAGGGPASPLSPEVSASPLGLLDAPRTGSSEGRALVPGQGGCGGTPLATGSAASWGALGNLPEVGDTPSAEVEDSVLQREGEAGSVAPKPFGLTPPSPPALLEASVDASLEQEVPVLHDGEGTWVSPTPAGSVETRMPSTLSLLEAGMGLSLVEKSLPWQQADSAPSPIGGASPRVSKASAHTSVEEKLPLWPQDACTSTPLSLAPAAAGTSLPNGPEAGRTVFQEEKGRVSCHSESSRILPLGCHCHGFWTSPLSLLEAGPGESPEPRPSVFFSGRKGAGVPAVRTASAEAQESLPGASVPGPNTPSLQRQEKGVSVTPVPTVSAATWTSPPACLDAGVNTSAEEKAVTKDSTAETDSLLWHCSREQLSGLSRGELEGRLESTLIIMEALSRQIRAGRDLWQPTGAVGPADQRDVSTQTPVSDPKQEEQLHRDFCAGLGRRFQTLRRSRESQQDLARLLADALGELRALSLGSWKSVEEGDARAAALRNRYAQMRLDYEAFRSLISRCAVKMQQMAKDVRAAREETEQHREVCQKLEERTVEVVAALGRVNELVEANAGLEKGLAAALQRATTAEGEQQQLHLEAKGLSQQLVEKQDTIRTLEEAVARLSREKERAEKERTAAQQDAREMSDCREFMEQENQITRRQLAETEEELRTTLASLRERTMHLEDLKDAHAALQEEREALGRRLASSEAELQSIQAHLEAFARSLQQIRAVHAEFLGVADTLRMALPGEAVDAAPRSSCYTPTWRTPHRSGASLVDSVLKAVAEKGSETPGIWSATTAFAKATPALPPTPSGAASDGLLPRSPSWALGLPEVVLEASGQWPPLPPFRIRIRIRGFRPLNPLRSLALPLFLTGGKQASLPAEQVGEVLKGLVCVCTRVPTADIQEDLAACVQDLKEVAAQIRLLSSQRQKVVREEAQGLQAKIAQLQQRSDDLESQLQAEREAGAASLAKMHKALQVRIQNEKELQEAVRQQEERMRSLLDHRWKVSILEEEVSQLKYALQKSETETSVLWEELRGTKEPDTDWVKEKMWLRQEVGKLRDLLLRKDEERVELSTSYLCQVRKLEGQLHQAKQALKKHEKAEAEMKEVLSTFQADVAGLPEVRRLIELLP